MARRELDPEVELVIGALGHNRRATIQLVERQGKDGLQRVLARAEQDLAARLNQSEGLAGRDGQTFTVAQMRSTLMQVRAVMLDVARGVGDEVLDAGEDAAGDASDHTVGYLVDAERAYRGVASQPLALDQASMFDNAVGGARSSILRRLISGPDSASSESGDREEADDDRDEADDEPDLGDAVREGVLARYGVEGVSNIERTLQQGVLQRRSWGDMRDDLVDGSTFLQGKPAYWAERIVRTEVMGAYNRAGWETMTAADEDLGDMCKILSATFDDRTGWDSYQVHGQIRRVDEPFAWDGGLYMYPPNRPNDREVVTPHRIAWPLPPQLAWVDDGLVVAAWVRDGRKGGPPPRPLMTTVPLERFGKD